MNIYIELNKQTEKNECKLKYIWLMKYDKICIIIMQWILSNKKKIKKKNLMWNCCKQLNASRRCEIGLIYSGRRKERRQVRTKLNAKNIP